MDSAELGSLHVISTFPCHGYAVNMQKFYLSGGWLVKKNDLSKDKSFLIATCPGFGGSFPPRPVHGSIITDC